MLKRLCLATVLAVFSASSLMAVEPVAPPESSQPSKIVRGRDLMTPEDWREHRQKPQGLATTEERQAYRREHRKMLEARAKEKGVILRDGAGWRGGQEPGPRGGGAGGGPGPGR
jgi:hypothetical protein